MPRDDREQNFEKALSRGLRSSNAAPDKEGNDCLDAEILAAYHERLLDPEEMAQRKAHIVSCERCQEILAQLEATDTIPVEADRDLLLDQIVIDIPETETAPTGAIAEPVVNDRTETASAVPPVEAAAQSEVVPEPEAEPEIIRGAELMAASAAPSTPSDRADLARPSTLFPAAVKSTAPSSSTITFHPPRENRPKLVRFVALAGALAAGLVLWLVYRDRTQQFDLAQNRSASKLELPPQSPAPTPPAENKEAISPSQTPDSNATASNATPQKNAAAPPPSEPSPFKPASQPSANEADAVANALKDAKKTVDSAKELEQKSRRDVAPGFAGKSKRDESAAAGALAAPRVAPRNGPDTNAGKLEAANAPSIDSAIAAAKLPSGIPSPSPPARTRVSPSIVTDSTGGVAPPLQVSTSGQADAAFQPLNGRVGTILTPLSVPAPGGTTIWRIGQAGMIQRSGDSGATWSIQSSGVVTDLIAGSASSDQICWVVGRNGTILRTTNGGATWQKINSPSNVDLLSVFAINSNSATITDAAGRAYETTSSGARWARTTNVQP
jgi:hypothetical protein